jgi:hypothetical protein
MGLFCSDRKPEGEPRKTQQAFQNHQIIRAE